MGPLDIAWAAGFLDGEGYFSLTTSGRSLAPLIVAQQADHREPLDKLAQLGGKVVERRAKTVTGRTVYAWSWRSAPEMQKYLPALIVHLTNKQEQARILLEVATHMLPRGKGQIHSLSRTEIEWRAEQQNRLLALRAPREKE